MSSSIPASVSDLELVALAAAAVPSLQPRGIRGEMISTESGQWLSFVDVAGEQWLAWAPSFRFTDAGWAKFERVLDHVTVAAARGSLPFTAAEPVGSMRRDSGGFVLVLRHPGGQALRPRDLESSGLLPKSVGSSLAALHELEPEPYARATGQFADAKVTRTALRRLVDAHAAAIPSRLRTRWTDAISEDSLWKFAPVPLHGSLGPEYIYAVPGGAVVGITRFDRAAVGDPAHDLMWLMFHASDTFLETFEEAYSTARTTTDLHVLTRAQLLSELETLRWYVRGVQAGDQVWRREGVQALRDLDADIGDQRLVATRREVVEITFTVDDEPLLKLQPHGTVAGSDRSAVQDQARAVSDSDLTEVIGLPGEETGAFNPTDDDPRWSGSIEVP